MCECVCVNFKEEPTIGKRGWKDKKVARYIFYRNCALNSQGCVPTTCLHTEATGPSDSKRQICQIFWIVFSFFFFFNPPLKFCMPPSHRPKLGPT